jgi:hypothetical protein
VVFGRLVRALRGALLLLSIALPASAQDPAAGNDDPALLSLGVGWFDLLKQENQAADFRLEYRSDLALWFIKPWIGMELTSDGAVYGAGGLLLDFVLGDHVYISPSVGVGAYARGNGRDLGSTVEFRSQFELGYRFDNRARLGVAFGHISNASISDRNPGTEILTLYLSIPFFGYH